VDEWLEAARLYESAGYSGVWIAEHHFFWDGWLTPTPTNPIVMGTAIAAQTTDLRIGFCGLTLPDHHPIRVAEDVAMLDHLSGGRVDFGVIRGINNRVNGNFHRDADRRDQKRNYALFHESLEVIKHCWTDSAFSHKGQFYEFPMPGWFEAGPAPEGGRDPRYYSPEGEQKALAVLPKPYQKPFPPIWQMADSPSSYVFAAEQGLNAICWVKGLEGVREIWTTYKETAERVRGVPVELGEGLAVMQPIFVAKTQEEADKVMRPVINEFLAHHHDAHRPEGRKVFLASHQELTSEELDMDWYDFLVGRDWGFVGTPQVVIEKLKKYVSEVNCQHIVAYWALPHLTKQLVLQSTELFAEEVMPAFADNNAMPAVAAAGAPANAPSSPA
jgi:alkanesulfonate monooxygenase SsuD/methylene tetrahydromethanopterin reductase-like flavin-dependent oxidoreductase (luciferase family)